MHLSGNREDASRADPVVRAALGDLIHRFAWCIDRRDWTGFRACLAPRVTVGLDTSIGGEGDDAEPEDADGRVLAARDFFEPFDATHHHVTLYSVSHEPGGDAAEVLSYFRAGHYKQHVLGGATFSQSGHYRHRCARTGVMPDNPTGWHITGWRQVIHFTEGNAKLLARGGDGAG